MGLDEPDCKNGAKQEGCKHVGDGDENLILEMFAGGSNLEESGQ
jgi:hypothetical protein